MHSIYAAAALVASVSLVAAAPAPLVQNTITLNQVPAGKVRKSGPQQILKTYRKFGKQPPVDAVHAAAAAQQTGSATASPTSEDESYLVPVTVGADTLHLDFDTGSSDLWVFSTVTPASDRNGQTLYNPSTGTLKSGYTWDISYGDGSGAKGVVYADKAVVGAVTATSQAIEAATSVSSEFYDDSATDGLLGLAFSSINTVKPQAQTTFFDTVGSSLAEYLFTADLKHNAPGTYTFGYIPSSAYTGSITYVPVDDSQGFWGFTAGSYSVGSGSNGTSSSSIGSAIADTGTTLMYLPTAAVQQYYSAVSGATYSSSQGGYTLPCNSNPPSFNVVIGGATFSVPGDFIAYAPISSGSSTCFGGIQENTGLGLTIFGDIFLKSVLAVFDKTQSSPRIGFAEQS